MSPFSVDPLLEEGNASLIGQVDYSGVNITKCSAKKEILVNETHDQHLVDSGGLVLF